MKKLLIPIVTLLAFSMLITSVSAPVPEYYAARFHGHTNGVCRVFDEYPGEGVTPTALGQGRIYIRGLAIVKEDTDYYLANITEDPNTRVWTRRTGMKASWEGEKLMVHMWPSDTVWGMFNDTMDAFAVANLTFSGYHKDASGFIQFARGTALIYFSEYGDPPYLMAMVMLYMGTEHWLSFLWIGEYEGMPPEYLARPFINRVTVWPISLLPIIR